MNSFNGVSPQPISTVNPYNDHWLIKARVTSKEKMREYRSSRTGQEGKVFSIDLLDDQGGEIRATMFNDVAEKLYSVINEGKVYMIYKGQAKIANKQFSPIKNPYSLTLDNRTEVVLCSEDIKIQQEKWSFIPITDIAKQDVNSFIDLIAIVNKIGTIGSITSKAQKQISKRNISLCDDSGYSIDLTLWADHCEIINEQSSLPLVVSIKAVRVTDFGGRTLNAGQGTRFTLSPDLPEAAKLLNWWNNEGSSMHLKSMTVMSSGQGRGSESRIVLADIDGQQLGTTKEKGDFVTFVGTINEFQYPSAPKLFENPNFYYNACPGDNCNKKVIDEGGGNWRCERCNKTYPNCRQRYIMSFTVADGTDSFRMTAFDNTGQNLVGKPASDLHKFVSERNENGIKTVFKKSLFKSYCFTSRIKQEIVKDIPIIKAVVIAVDDIDYTKESRLLVQEIQKKLEML